MPVHCYASVSDHCCAPEGNRARRPLLRIGGKSSSPAAAPHRREIVLVLCLLRSDASSDYLAITFWMAGRNRPEWLNNRGLAIDSGFVQRKRASDGNRDAPGQSRGSSPPSRLRAQIALHAFEQGRCENAASEIFIHDRAQNSRNRFRVPQSVSIATGPRRECHSASRLPRAPQKPRSKSRCAIKHGDSAGPAPSEICIGCRCAHKAVSYP
jgi:hypothetical protein